MKKLIIAIGLIVLVAVASIGVRAYMISRTVLRMNGNTMTPSYLDGDLLKIDYNATQLSRGDVVVFRLPSHPESVLVKRVIGMPGETVEIKDGKILIDSKVLNETGYFQNVPDTPNYAFTAMQLGGNDYFVLGDNRAQSFDSRSWGPLPASNIAGVVVGRL